MAVPTYGVSTAKRSMGVPAHAQLAGADTTVVQAEALTVAPRPLNAADFAAALGAG